MALRQIECFNDRDDAGRQLGEALSFLQGQHPLILAIPRGGVPLGRIVADRLEGELDVVLVRKIGAPGHKEYAIGAVDENGDVQISPDAASVGANDHYITQEATRQLATIRARRKLYSPYHKAVNPEGRVVVVVDDGLATGETMRAALRAVSARKPARLICAVPVASPRSLSAIADLVDDLVYLSAPDDFRAVGQFYLEFPAVEDSEVVNLLERPAKPRSNLAQTVHIDAAGMTLMGELVIPEHASALVIFAHGSGSNRMSTRNRRVAEALHERGFATLLFDLLAEDEARDVLARFDIPRLASRLLAALQWAAKWPGTASLPVGLFGASTGAAAALVLAANYPKAVRVVVSRGGRPDLAGLDALAGVKAPTLLIVGGADAPVIALNRAALSTLTCPVELAIVPNATHLFEESGAIEKVAELAADWFVQWFPRSEVWRDRRSASP